MHYKNFYEINYNYYNGNIAAQVMNIPTVGEALVYGYKYDQLNRIKEVNNYNNYNSSNNTWSATNAHKETLSFDANGNIQTALLNGSSGNLPYENFTYNYDAVKKNRLLSIHNSVNSTTSNYNYDEIGNITKDELEGNKDMVWSIYGKLLMAKKISTGVKITYSYDASGNRISKQVGNSYEEWTVRDAAGNVMATYVKDPAINNGKLTTQGYEMYGSSSIGTWEKHRDVETEGANNNERVLIRGEQKIRFSNHLGNTMLVLSDIKRQIQSPEDPSQITGYTPEVINATDYSAYGENLIGREFSSEGIKFGFNGKLNDNDLGYQDYGMRLSSVKKRGFLSVDPLTAKFPFYSPYQFAGNMPIRYIDLDGAEPAEPGKEKGEIQTGTNGNSDIAKSWKWDGNKWNENELQEIVLIAKKKYVPEQDFINNPLTKYNSKGESGYRLSGTASIKSLLFEFAQNRHCSSCHNTIVIGGDLLNNVKNLRSVQRLFRQGVEALYDKNTGFSPGTTYTGSYRMSDLNGPDGDRMKRKVLEELLNGKSLINSSLFSAEYFLGSFGFSMRVANDGKYMIITVYDSKTIQSATDGGNPILKQFFPLNEDTAPTYQRYLWTMPIGEVINAYKESMISEYKSRN